MPLKKIVFISASTGFLEAIAIINAINSVKPTYEVIAILDDNPETHNKVIRGVKVEGALTLAQNYKDAYFIFGIGSMKTRLIRNQLLEKMDIDISRFETIIHPSAVIDSSAVIGNGCIIHPGAVVGNDVVVEPFVTIAVNSAIAPYAHIESFAMITSLVVILSHARIGQSVFVGSCSCVTENIVIGKGSLIGAGTIVSRNIEKGSFYLGNPGRLINKIEID
jgi:sugar O-acyltransferase (sialic acid O-acetyltransferase NeuD family)